MKIRHYFYFLDKKPFLYTKNDKKYHLGGIFGIIMAVIKVIFIYNANKVRMFLPDFRKKSDYEKR